MTWFRRGVDQKHIRSALSDFRVRATSVGDPDISTISRACSITFDTRFRSANKRAIKRVSNSVRSFFAGVKQAAGRVARLGSASPIVLRRTINAFHALPGIVNAVLEVSRLGRYVTRSASEFQDARARHGAVTVSSSARNQSRRCDNDRNVINRWKCQRKFAPPPPAPIPFLPLLNVIGDAPRSVMRPLGVINRLITSYGALRAIRDQIPRARGTSPPIISSFVT